MFIKLSYYDTNLDDYIEDNLNIDQIDSFRKYVGDNDDIHASLVFRKMCDPEGCEHIIPYEYKETPDEIYELIRNSMLANNYQMIEPILESLKEISNAIWSK